MDNFPNDFIFGVSTSAFQIEGAVDEDGKGENIWDRLIRTQPELIRDGSDGKIACDSYHKYEEDIQRIKEIGFKAYKFSISWVRILPDGVVWNVNQAGIDHYNELIDELLRNKIAPMVCLYHFDLPQKLQDIGGWCNPLIADYFSDYAKLAFQTFGDRVKWWLTMNEPTEEVHGYVDRRYAPYLSLECLDGHYIVVHNMIRAHAKAYRVYEEKFKATQRGKVSIALKAWFYKAKTDSEEDKAAAYRALQFTIGWCAHPIYSRTGDYHPIMRQLTDENSVREGKPRSKLPQFTLQELKEIKGSYDFMAINHYTSALVSNNVTNEIRRATPIRDARVIVEFDSSWPATAAHWSRVVPWGFKEILCWIKKEYNNPPVYVTENGFADRGELEDIGRINFHKAYLKEMLNAIHQNNCNVIAYHAWSLLDNFEWLGGYSCKYGIVKVNFDSPDLQRIYKCSAKFFQNLCKTKRLS